jgi:hypothetical protein
MLFLLIPVFACGRSKVHQCEQTGHLAGGGAYGGVESEKSKARAAVRENQRFGAVWGGFDLVDWTYAGGYRMCRSSGR